MAKFLLPHDHGNHKGAESLHLKLENEGHFEAVSELFKQLSDQTRIRIFWLLSHREECVINISALLKMTSPAVSHHLKALKECGLIESRRDGKEVYYKTRDTEQNILLHNMIENIMEITCPKSENHEESTGEIIIKIHDYLLEHLSERITIEELSRRFLINPTTLKQAFREAYGMSVAAHTNEHRMEKAASLLENGSNTIAEIAQAVGFTSQSRFTTAFKQHYGILPTKYRTEKSN